jgi:nitrite reductase/ring-hydroxylating ferredoxin subunit
MTVREPEIVEVVNDVIENRSPLNSLGSTFKNGLHKAILNGGEPARKLADLLHGTWLGHPVHPVLTDVTIGAWLFGAVFDAISLLDRSKYTQKTADDLTTIGIISAVPTALAGLTDYSAIKKDAAGHGALHGILNSAGLLLYILSLRARKTDRRGLGLMLSTTALGALMGSAWLGGEMVYRLRVGVNHSEPSTQPDNWTVLLYRHNGAVHAIGAVCAHAGGPLEEGKFYGYCVQCPWHDSVYDVRDGSVVHGPSTYAQPLYEARVFNGEIQIRAAQTQQQPQNSQ